MSYGFSFPEIWRRGAELVLNLRTAKALGITITPTFLTRVNRLIE